MEFAKTNQIRQLIREARSRSGEGARLRELVQRSIPRMHTAIQLPLAGAADALTDFALRYAGHVPDFMDALTGLSREAGIHDYAAVFLDPAQQFFLDPPEQITRHNGLERVLAQSYLANRLIEELNDRVVNRCGIPLAPVDMTRANLVMHQLLGEPFANDLDFLIHYTTELHLDKQELMETPAFHRYIKERQRRGWDVELGRWPCLAEGLSINFAFRAETGLSMDDVLNPIMEGEIPEGLH